MCRKTLPLLFLLLACALASAVAGETTPRAALTHEDVVRQATAKGLRENHLAMAERGAKLVCALQDLEGRVTEAGLDLRSISETEGRGALRVRVAGLDRTAWGETDLGPGCVQVVGDKARIWRQTVMQEISTSADGVRQDFLVLRRPEGEGLLRLRLAVAGATISPHERDLRLTLASGRELSWHGLHVTDADGEILQARWELLGDAVATVIVDDADARYPVRIDPTFSDVHWHAMADVPGVLNNVTAMTVFDGKLLLAMGGRSIAGGIEVRGLVAWDGSSWDATPFDEFPPWSSGVGVQSFEQDGTNLYAIGADACVYHWDGSSWANLGQANGLIATSVIHGGVLYVGGDFTWIEGVSANRVAKWNGTTWEALGGGCRGLVLCLESIGTDLYVGGSFTDLIDSTKNYLKVWDGLNWQAPPATPNENVSAMLYDGSNLYISGLFTSIGAVDANRAACWNGSAWTALGSGLNHRARDIIDDGAGGFIFCGEFTMAGGATVNHIARWNGTDWEAFARGSDQRILRARLFGGSLYVGGDFGTIGGKVAYRIARWDGSAWQSLCGGINGDVHSLLLDGSNLYVGGDFTQIDTTSTGGIACWDGSMWTALGAGTDGTVSTMAKVGSDLYAAGSFSNAGGSTVNNIARWDGANWHALGTGVDGTVNVLETDGVNLYAGGEFDKASGSWVYRIATWDGSNWSGFGNGANGHVHALCYADGLLYAGGDFQSMDNMIVDGLAVWDGSAWSKIGTWDTMHYVKSMTHDGSNLYIAGDIGLVDGVEMYNIAKWDGASWSPLGTGLNSDRIYALTAGGGYLFAGGEFNQAGGQSAENIAVWDGSAWTCMGSGTAGAGLQGEVYALALDGIELYVGGRFDWVGDKPAPRLARAHLDWTPAVPVDIDDRANVVDLGSLSGTDARITAHANDPEGATVIYSLLDDAGGLFAIDGSSGVVTVTRDIVPGDEDWYMIQVAASDGASSSDAWFLVTIEDITQRVISVRIVPNPTSEPVLDGAVPHESFDGTIYTFPWTEVALPHEVTWPPAVVN